MKLLSWLLGSDKEDDSLKEKRIAFKAMQGIFSENSVRDAFIKEGYSEREARELAKKYAWHID